MLSVAAETFAITPGVGATTDSRTDNTTGRVFSPLKTTVLLLVDDVTSLCLVTTPCYADFFPFTNLVRQRLGAILGLRGEQIAVFSSHNHSCVMLSTTYPFADQFPEENVTLRDDQLTAFGTDLVNGLVAAARRLKGKLVPVEVSWAVGRERRVSYNRKGRRADGSTYLMREEDRVLLGQDFNGDIDDDAPVVAFQDAGGRPVCFLVQFTCHPCTAYHPESPITFGDFPQVAADDLSAAHGGVPVAFLQGCAGEINSKFFLAPIPVEERVAHATRLGHYLGETYVAASQSLTRSKRRDLGLAWQRVFLPFTPVPAARKLRADLAVMAEFLQRVRAGDNRALTCLGLNVARTMSPQYRAKLVEPCQRWAEWALRFHTENRLHEAPRGVAVVVGAFRIGDVGVVGLPAEPFLGIGRQIRAGSKLPLTIPAGYMNDNVAYVEDSPNVGDTDYSSSYYRYTAAYLPWKKPGGDLLARAGVRMLNQLAKRKKVTHVEPV
ncbi:hypothetical protein HQ590_06090 [bacterium]|nr:hypothetical protein [bacterium]